MTKIIDINQEKLFIRWVSGICGIVVQPRNKHFLAVPPWRYPFSRNGVMHFRWKNFQLINKVSRFAYNTRNCNTIPSLEIYISTKLRMCFNINNLVSPWIKIFTVGRRYFSYSDNRLSKTSDTASLLNVVILLILGGSGFLKDNIKLNFTEFQTSPPQ